MSSKYIGITFGPVYKTIAMGNKTRETWAASYLFSYMSRNLIEALNEKGCKSQNYIMPYWNSSLFTEKPGAGFLPDKIILLADEVISFELVKNTIIEIKKNLAEEIYNDICNLKNKNAYSRVGINNLNKTEVHKYITTYFQIYSFEIDLSKEHIKGYNKLKTINAIIDNLDLRTSIIDADPNPLRIFLHAVNQTFLLKDCFADKIDHFDSLPEIALRELRNYYPKEYDHTSNRLLYELLMASEAKERIAENEIEDEIEEKLFKNIYDLAAKENKLKQYHKYVAIVTADGDHFGKMLTVLEKNNLNSVELQAVLERFSIRINEFSMESYKILAGSRYTQNNKENWGYGAAPVYMGGDDLLFFAPIVNIVNNKRKTIFDTIKEIDNCFNRIFDIDEYNNLKDENGNQIKPCMSYGIYISYIKFPLREAVIKSRELLDKIKEGEYKSRNRINFEVNLHSGSTFTSIINKNDINTSKQFIDLITDANAPEDDTYIAALTNEIRSNPNKSYEIAKNEWHLESFFKEEFNKKIHEKSRVYLDNCRKFLYDMYQLNDYPDKENIMNHFLGVLKLNHFLQSKSKK